MNYFQYCEMKENSKGSYVGIKYSKKTIDSFTKLQKELNLSNPLDNTKFHSTVIYSRKVLNNNFIVLGTINQSLDSTLGTLEEWKTQSGKTALVLKLSSKFLTNRHNEIMKNHNGTHDFDDYTPHVTLSYELNENEIGKFNKKNIKLDSIPVIINEYLEELDLDWNGK